MKQIILEVLEDLSQGQINLASKVARETIANSIMAAIKSEGWFLDLGENEDNDICKHGNLLNSTCSECDEQQIKKSWVCNICGKSTYEVDFDYIGSGANHLGCELKIEMARDKQNETK